MKRGCMEVLTILIRLLMRLQHSSGPFLYPETSQPYNSVGTRAYKGSLGDAAIAIKYHCDLG